MSKRGVDILILADTAAEEATAPIMEPVGGQRGVTLSESNDTYETTNKLSPGRTREYEVSFYGWSLSLDGVHVAGEPAYEALRKSVRAGKAVMIQIKDGNSIEQGLGLVTSRELEAPYDGESTYTMEIQGTGELKPVENGPTGAAAAASISSEELEAASIPADTTKASDEQPGEDARVAFGETEEK